MTGFLGVFRCLQQHLDSFDVTNVRISQNGRKLMCLTHNDSPYVYDLLHQQHYGVRLKATKFRNRYDNRTSCFAGAGDEYVVCISDDLNFYIWKLPMLDCHGKNFSIFAWTFVKICSFNNRFQLRCGSWSPRHPQGLWSWRLSCTLQCFDMHTGFVRRPRHFEGNKRLTN